jgi:cobalt-zinc-cadmium resistance protein CzcA
LQASLPPGVKIDAFYDRSALIERAVGTVTHALLEATVLVVLLLSCSSAKSVRPWSSR